MSENLLTVDSDSAERSENESINTQSSNYMSPGQMTTDDQNVGVEVETAQDA